MCITAYIQERAQELERDAQHKITVIDEVIVGLITAQTRAIEIPRHGSLLAVLLGMHAELCQQKAAALRVIEDACALRQQTQEI